MKKILFSFLISLFFIFPAFSNEIQKYINKSDFEIKSTVSIYAADEKTGEVIFKKNESKLLNPASTLKTLTFGAAYLTLGKDYGFETALYKDSKNNIYLKLAADPLLSSGDLNTIFKDLKSKFDVSKIQNIYIDDTIIDKIPYPAGWMTDDIWPNSRPVTPYIVDKNFTNIAINRSSLATKVDIIQNDDYKLPVINELKLASSNSNVQDIKIVRLYGENSPIVTFQGMVSRDEILKLPVLNPELNFKIKVLKAISKNEISFGKTLQNKKTPESAVKIASVSHSIKDVSKDILLNSDNFASEVVFKVAAAKYIDYSREATTSDAVSMFKNVFAQFLDEDIKIVDASGVSRYNLLSPEFIVKCLSELFKDSDYKPFLATSNQGTLKDRLVFLENNLRAKTGTLSQMSSIAGGLTTQKGKDIVFSIIIQNSPKRKAVLKNFENTVIGIIYKNY